MLARRRRIRIVCRFPHGVAGELEVTTVKRRRFALTCLLTLTLLLASSTMPFPLGMSGQAQASEVVTFLNANLEAAIRDALGKPTGDITAAALAELTMQSRRYI